jgi:hypothetical protein
MKTILAATALTFTTPPLAANFTPIKPIRVAACFSTGEQDAGMNKICYYDCLGSPVAINIESTQLCPLTIVSWSTMIHRAAHRLRCVQAATPEAMTSRHEQGHCKSRIQITLPG